VVTDNDNVSRYRRPPERGAFFAFRAAAAQIFAQTAQKRNRFFKMTFSQAATPARPGRAGVFNARLVETQTTKKVSLI